MTVRPGDPHSVAELRAALPGHDVVLSTLGAPGPGHSTLLRDCAASTVAAMREAGVRRLFVVSAAVLFPDAPLAWLLRRTLLRSVAQDSAEMERIVMASGLDWTIARPPRLTNGPLTRRYRVADGELPRRGIRISRADVAHFLPGELGCPLNNLAQEMSPLDERFRRLVDATFDAWRKGFAQALERGRADGTVRQDVDARKVAAFLVAAAEGSYGLAKSANSRTMLRSNLETLATYLDTLRAAPRDGRPTR